MVGGINPPAHKEISLRNDPVRLQTRVFHLPYRSRSGRLHKLTVKPGDRVKGGQLLNVPRHGSDRQLRAPTSGLLQKEIRVLVAGRVPHYSPALVLASDGQDVWEHPPQPRAWQEVSRHELIQRIARAGIYGMGGGGFPTLVKLQAARIETLIINAAECEPYITADHCLLEHKSDELVQGIAIVAKILQNKRTIIGIEENMVSALKALRTALRATTQMDHAIELQEIEAVYPTGGERQLINILLGQEVPSGQLPTTIGILCLNVATLCAIYRAVAHGEILRERLVTVTGPAVTQPRNYWVPLGMPIGVLMEAVGQTNWQDQNLLMGGGMMNYPVRDENMPVGAGHNCFLLMRRPNGERAQPHRECISCGLCEQACPAHLQPQLLYRFIKADQLEQAEEHYLADCIECAACDFVCPSEIPLSHYYVFAKDTLKEEQERKMKADRARIRFNEHKQRMTQEAQMLEARRQERRRRLLQPNQPIGDGKTTSDEARGRKTAMLDLQIKKTQQAIAKWEAKQDPAEMQKIDTLRAALRQLQNERKQLNPKAIDEEQVGMKNGD